MLAIAPEGPPRPLPSAIRHRPSAIPVAPFRYDGRRMELNAPEFQPVLDALPAPAALLLGAAVVVGFVIWVLGRKLARPACAISGLVLGGLGGLVVAQKLASQGAMTLPLIIGGSIGGALLAAFLFRVWMGLSGAVLLALLAPAASIVWQGTPLPEIDVEAARQSIEQPVEQERVEEERPRRPTRATAPRRVRTPRRDAGREPAVEAEAPEAGTAAWSLPGAASVEAVRQRVVLVYESQSEAIRAWWDGLGAAGRFLLIAAALIGAGVGLMLGLIAPYWAAGLESALVGSILMLYAGRELAYEYAPAVASVLPGEGSPRWTLITLGLITLVGAILQWALFRKRADRSS